MKKLLLFPAVAALLLLGCSQSGPKDALSVIQRYEEVSGFDKVDFRQTPMRMKMHMDAPNGTKMSCDVVVAPPDRFRIEMGVGGQTALFGADGDQGWMLPPDGSGVQLLPKEQVEAFFQQFNVMSGIKWDTTAFDFTLLPTVKKDGKTYDVVQSMPKADSTGVEQSIYFDRATGLPEYAEFKTTVAGREVNGKVDFGPYVTGAGIKYPSRISSSADGAEIYSVNIDTLIVNCPVADSLFARPE